MAEVTVIDRDMGYKKLSKSLADLGSVTSKAGLLRGQAPKDVVLYGAKNQFGDESVPARPWLTYAWDAGAHEEYGDLLMSSLDEYLFGGDISAVERGFSVVASIAAQDIEKTIKTAGNGTFEPLAAETITGKGNKRILIDTGALLHAIDDDVFVSKKPFKAADTSSSVARQLLAPGSNRGGGKKRGRKVSFRRRAKNAFSLAKSPGYSGKGIRARPESRASRTAAGVASRGVRRRGSAF